MASDQVVTSSEKYSLSHSGRGYAVTSKTVILYRVWLWDFSKTEKRVEVLRDTVKTRILIFVDSHQFPIPYSFSSCPFPEITRILLIHRLQKAAKLTTATVRRRYAANPAPTKQVRFRFAIRNECILNRAAYPFSCGFSLLQGIDDCKMIHKNVRMWMYESCPLNVNFLSCTILELIYGPI